MDIVLQHALQLTDAQAFAQRLAQPILPPDIFATSTEEDEMEEDHASHLDVPSSFHA